MRFVIIVVKDMSINLNRQPIMGPNYRQEPHQIEPILYQTVIVTTAVNCIERIKSLLIPQRSQCLPNN
jgi:hypothetical protein